jgi:hypothetical protein
MPPDGGPVLTIDTSKTDGELKDSAIRYLVRDLIAEGKQPEQVKLGDFEGLAFRYVEDDFYWRHWLVTAGHWMLDVNYDCALSEKGRHDVAIDSMLNSLRLNDGAI